MSLPDGWSNPKIPLARFGLGLPPDDAINFRERVYLHRLFDKIVNETFRKMMPMLVENIFTPPQKPFLLSRRRR